MRQSVYTIEACRSSDPPTSGILIVEGGKDITSDAIQRLASRGVAVDRVENGDQALELLARQTYALVMIDSAVDGQQGMNLLARVAAGAPQLPVVMTTGSASVRQAVEAMQKGAVDYLMKPISAEALETCVLHFLAAGPEALSPPAEGPAGDDNPFITACPAVEQILASGRAVAGSKATVLITGESGTGKEVLAAYIHRHAGHGDAPYVAVNCAALPDTLMESELFGYEKGAFTGALNRKSGKFEQAGQGTLVLDEISEMPMALQAKLLRVLQERRIDRIGSDRNIPFQAQVIAISNRDLEELVRSGQMREDLYYRINVIPLHLPPLRERRMDIALLAHHFRDRYSRMYQRQGFDMTAAVIADLETQDWQGNIRELENTIERAVLTGTLGPRPGFIGPGGKTSPDDEVQLTIRPGLSVKAVEEVLIRQTLNEVNDHREQAARMLGISVRTLRNKLKEYQKQSAA